MKQFNINNYIGKLGENADENWRMFDASNSTHLFLHLSSFPSGYFIIQCDDTPLMEEISEAALICKQNTKFRNLKNIKVDYTTCDNLKKGKVVGEVQFISNRKVKQIKI